MTTAPAPNRRRTWLGSIVLLLAVLGAGGALVWWKLHAMAEAGEAAAHQPEPMETVTVALAAEHEYQPTTTSIGTVIALQSITLHNEIAGTVAKVSLRPGQVVEPGTVLVQLDVSVEEAELHAQEAQAKLAGSMLERMQRAESKAAASAADVDKAKSERDVALAQVARIQAVIARKTIRAPFRARVGMEDVHQGQYLKEGTQLTTLQGVDDAVHVDFTVTQSVAAGLKPGDRIKVATGTGPAVTAGIEAIDARVDPTTRNAWVRARLEQAEGGPLPGASVRVHVSVGPAQKVVTVPVSALRKGPGGDHVFVIGPDDKGKQRAHMRTVQGGPNVGEDVIVLSGLTAGEQVAALGSFKLHEGALVSVAGAGDGNRRGQ